MILFNFRINKPICNENGVLIFSRACEAIKTQAKEAFALRYEDSKVLFSRRFTLKRLVRNIKMF